MATKKVTKNVTKEVEFFIHETQEKLRNSDRKLIYEGFKKTSYLCEVTKSVTDTLRNFLKQHHIRVIIDEVTGTNDLEIFVTLKYFVKSSFISQILWVILRGVQRALTKKYFLRKYDLWTYKRNRNQYNY